MSPKSFPELVEEEVPRLVESVKEDEAAVLVEDTIRFEEKEKKVQSN